MLHLLDYPFDSQTIMKKRRGLKRELLSFGGNFLDKKVAILGGSTTKDITEILELFLLKNNIKPAFYESEFGQYWEDAIFDNPILEEFSPDLFYIHTSNRNLQYYPSPSSSKKEIDQSLSNEFTRYEKMWDSLRKKYGCLVIQNNFELPFFRILGNLDSVDFRGRTNYILKLNSMFATYAENNADLIINDINYLSASFGLQKWSAPQDWYLYKYSLAISAIPFLSFSVANLIKAVYGKNKKALILDLDNTLWEGVIGDDGPEGIEIGEETSLGQAYREFQSYIKMHKDIGILLAINSKNDLENAVSGLTHPDGLLRPEDFQVIKANWNNKDANIREIAQELNLGADSFVFVDDNIVERDIVKKGTQGVAVPEIVTVESYITTIDKAGYFEIIELSKEDIVRNQMYKVNVERKTAQKEFFDYTEYLLSLEMIADIKTFESIYVSRIAQLTNKTNQFNLTTKRFSQSEIELIMADDLTIKISGRLRDKFGDNGVTSLVIGTIEDTIMNIELWLMSCRVLKRNMEFAMMDALVEEALEKGIKTIKGYYIKTAKNQMVKEFYGSMGFKLIGQEGENTIWQLELEAYQSLNKVIQVNV